MHLLVIEDNPDLVANLCDYLEGRGHHVEVAYDGYSGLGRAIHGIFDAMVLDLMLPGLNGLEVCSRLRQAGKRVPVLILTARDTLEDKLEGFGSGADDYLVKPFDLPELEARLNALARRGRCGSNTLMLRVGDLTFAPDTLRVQRNGHDLELPPIPLRLLEVLIRATPRVVTRAELEQAVWGDNPPDSDALRSHLHQLRTIIDRPFPKPLLHTLRGLGYRLAEEPVETVFLPTDCVNSA
ncbi:Transcriptional regulatory protein TcrA [Gammaproteobacteria bacterium]